jgi:predicted DNA-binding transcriptional regulator AlpA
MAELMTAHEVAELLRVTAATLARWRSNDQGPPFVQLEGSIRYSRPAVDAWLAARARGGASESA